MKLGYRNLLNFFKNIISIHLVFYKNNFKIPNFSYSQWGEDIIVNNILKNLKIENATYLDIGANDPIILNNTWLLYLNNMRGVLIEPDPNLCKKLRKIRPKDKVINCGLGSKNSVKKLYVINDNALSTFKLDEAISYINMGKGYKIIKEVEVSICTINEMIDKYFVNYPNFISIDVEGMEMEIIQKFDFSKFKTEVFCIETYSFSKNIKKKDIIEFLKKNGYFIFADTGLNSIFIKEGIW